MEGIIGLMSGSGGDTDPLFMYHAYNAGILTENTFSIFLTTTSTEIDSSGASYIDFGAPDSTIVAQGVTYIPNTAGDGWWTADVTGFYLEDDPSTLYQLTTASGITDSGSSAISGPEAEVEGMKTLLKTYLTDYTEDSDWGALFYCSERSNLPNFYMAYGDYWFQVRPEDYATCVNWTDDVCGFTIDSYDGGWILGNSFMRGYYIIHDAANQQQGFIPVDEGNGLT